MADCGWACCISWGWQSGVRDVGWPILVLGVSVPSIDLLFLQLG